MLSLQAGWGNNMQKYIKVICHLIEDKTIQDLAQAVNDVWGTARLDSDCVEKFLPQVNTPTQDGGYIAIKMTETQARNLEDYSKVNDLSWITDWYRIEWPQYETQIDGEGNVYQVRVPYDDVTWEELIIDENGDPVQFPILDPETGEPTGETETRTHTKYLGGFA